MRLNNLRDNNNFYVLNRSITLFLTNFYDFFQAPEGIRIHGNVYASNDCYYDEFYNHYCPEQNEDFFLNFDNVTDASGSINFQFKIRNFSSVSFSVFSSFSVFFNLLEFNAFFTDL